MQSSTDNRVRVYHTDLLIGSFLLKYFHSLLLAVEQELNLPLELPKLDIVYVPLLTTRTLPKWGLILVGVEMSPVENSVVHSIELKDIQKEIATSVYQMYFGQLIVPEWWTSQWITRGLARYFSGITSHLPFDAEKEFVSDTVQMVIRNHANSDYTEYHWMGYSYYSTDQINNPTLYVVDQRGIVNHPVLYHTQINYQK